MADAILISALLVGTTVGVATTAVAVWTYNRTLAPFVEMPLKKPAALLALPAGIPVGMFAAWRVATGTSGLLETGLLLIAAIAGVLILMRHFLIAAVKWRLAAGSTWRRVEGMPEALNAREFLDWQRVMLCVLSPINQVGALRVHTREVHFDHLSPAFDGYRIVHVTDPHVHPTLNPEWYEAAIGRAMKEAPDLVLHGGDFITRSENLLRAAEVLSPLSSAPDGAFTVRGNHDLWKAPRRAARAARQAGMRLLSNEGVVIRRGDAELAIIGLESPYVPLGAASESRLRRLPAARIALVHTPDAFPLARALGCGLALAGHTHGGQVRLPIIGATVTSCAAGPRTSTGLWIMGGNMGRMWCVTSNGLGSFFPLRFLCPPEIVVIVLRSKNSA